MNVIYYLLFYKLWCVFIRIISASLNVPKEGLTVNSHNTQKYR